jgi:RNase P/RNase MRP subunit POP5
MNHARERNIQIAEIIQKSVSLASRVTPGKQEVDSFCPVRVSGWIKKIQHRVIEEKNNEHRGNRNLSIFKD